MIKIYRKKSVITFFIIILILIISLLVFKNEIFKIIYPKKYSEIVSIYKGKYEIDENLIYAVIKAESNFNKEAKSGKGAIGLMQIMEETAKEIARKNNMQIDFNNMKTELLNEDKNISIGTKYLSELIIKYGNIELALTAYNAGIGTVNNWIEKKVLNSDGSNIENIPYKETNNYVRKILNDYKIYNELYPKN